jgi:hypothetical protein
VVVALAFGVFVFLTWSTRSISLISYLLQGQTREIVVLEISGTSPWGMVRILPQVMLFLFGMFLPSIAAGSVARDLRQRTQELLMSTAVSTRAYVWGRYMAALLVALGMAVLMLLSILLTGFALSLGGDYPPPNIIATLALWATVVVPTTVLITGLSFALGTLLPKFSNPIKVLVLIAWFLSMYLALLPLAPDWYLDFDPTGRVMSRELESHYRPESGPDWNLQFPQDRAALEQVQQSVRRVEQKMPDLLPWVPPKLVHIGLGLALVALSAAGFRRFRNVRQ